MSYKLVSVSNKQNIEILCSFFIEQGNKILTTGGTYNYLLTKLPEYKDSIIKISDITGFPEILDGRVKTLHPKIFGSLLCKYDNESHLKSLTEHNIPHIDTVVVNLYPFSDAVKKGDHDNIIENIDIGGHSLIRASAKNYKNILTITDPNDYGAIINNTVNNIVPSFMRNYLSRKAFNHISEYDICISNYYDKNLNCVNDNEKRFNRVYKHSFDLKYGCNPNQNLACINTFNKENPFTIINGSFGYINIIDAINSWQLVKELSECLDLPCATSFKHTTPAGVGTSKPLSDKLKEIYDVNEDLTPVATAFIRARNTDPMSSFGDFIAISHTVDSCTAKLIKRFVSDGIVAPDYTDEALEILKSKRNGKYLILKVDKNYVNEESIEIREMFGISLVQTVNNYKMKRDKIGDLVTNTDNFLNIDNDKMSDIEMDLIIANISLKYAQSNNVSLAHDGQLIGLAAGQQNRVDCVRLAGEKSKLWLLRGHPKVLLLNNFFKTEVKRQEKLNAAIRYIQGDFTDIELKDWEKLFTQKIEPLTLQDKTDFLNSFYSSKDNIISLASDGFFPFRDNIDFASKYGVNNIIQPGGSSADDTIIETCNKYSINMFFTGSRLFYH